MTLVAFGLICAVVLGGTAWGILALTSGDQELAVVDNELAKTTPESEPEPTEPKLPIRAKTASFGGQVLDAVTGLPLNGASVSIQGTEHVRTTTADGLFRFVSVNVGHLTLDFEADGFAAESFPHEIGNGPDSDVRVAMSPPLEPNQIRTILTWNDGSLDLDAHLVGPMQDGGTFHASARSKLAVEAQSVVRVDVHSENGQKPETITLSAPIPGTYNFFVHDFTHNEDSDADQLSQSGGEAKILVGDKVYRFETRGRRIGNVWHVCDIVVGEDGVRVERVNAYESKKIAAGPQAFDIVFLLDWSGPRIFNEQTAENCQKYIEALVGGGIDARFALVSFDRRAPQQHTPTQEPGAAAAVISKLDASPGENKPAPDAQLNSLAGAIDRALFFSYRDNAAVIFMMISPNQPAAPDRLRQLSDQLLQRKIEAVIFTEPAFKQHYADLGKAGRVIAFNEDTGPNVAATSPASSPSDTSANTTPNNVKTPQTVGNANTESRELVVTVRNVDDLLSRFSFDSSKQGVDSAISLIGRYRRRTLPERYRWIEEFGGTHASEDAVALALEWLARHQDKDGRWSKECLVEGDHRQCEKGPLCSGPGEMVSMAHTGLAVLALQAGGHFDFLQQKYSGHVRKGLDWIVSHQGTRGQLSDPTGNNLSHNPMYEHGIAAFAVCEACAVAKAAGRKPHPRYLNAAKKAVEYIVHAQRNDGGWRYSIAPTDSSDTSVTGWQVLALQSAREAGIPFSEDVITNASRFFISCENENGRTGYEDRRVVTESTTGIGMLFQQLVLEQPESNFVKQGALYMASYAERRWTRAAQRWKKLQQTSPKGRIPNDDADFYMWYNCSLAMFHAGGEPWKRWNNVVRDVLIGTQNKDSQTCLRGSWDSRSKWGSRGGRIYSTAMAALTLQVYYRYEAERSK